MKNIDMIRFKQRISSLPKSHHIEKNLYFKRYDNTKKL